MAADYAPIEDYGAIGDLRSVALVSRHGSLDWCCFPYLDRASVFAALLDRRRGGRFSVRPASGRATEQRYVSHTNVLETEFESVSGRLTVTDFMPLEGVLEGCASSKAEHLLYRVLRAEGGPVEVDVEWSPRFDYARATTTIERQRDGFLAHADAVGLTLTGLPQRSSRLVAGAFGPELHARFPVSDGQPLALVMRWLPDVSDAAASVATGGDAQGRLERTVEAWRKWVHADHGVDRTEWAGERREDVIRSELATKLLIHADTGAIAAAATTSLPEEIGGQRNWDYRFTWIRDASLAAQALFSLGHRTDAEAFIEWAEITARKEEEKGWGLRILYGLHGEDDLREEELFHLEGYRGSSPVRVGNAAISQLQLDVYGELISAAYEVIRLGGRLDPRAMAFLPYIADEACAAWREPDHGIWELRNGPFHLVHSKTMVWVALDRALKLAARGLIQGNTEEWRRNLRAVRNDVLEQGFDEKLGAFKQSYERSVLDASNVRIPMLEFLPVEDPRVQSTLDRTLEHLTEGHLVHRYRAEDGLPGTEGAFSVCAFWLVNALALSRRMDEAHALFEGMLERSNHLGLYSEMVDPASGVSLGNFPQVYVHVGLINSTLYLAEAEGRKLPVPSLIGTELRDEKLREERRRRAR